MDGSILFPSTPSAAARSAGPGLLPAASRDVRGELVFVDPRGPKPASYTYEPPPGVPARSGTYETRTVAIHDLRAAAEAPSLDVQGFALVAHRSAASDFHDEAEIERVVRPEAASLVAAATGAARVVVFDHTLRAAAGLGRAVREPVRRVHNDYTERSAPQRVRDLMGAEAEALLARRFAIVNVWRPIRGPLRDAPLAMCDARSLSPRDLVPSALIYRDRVGETYAVAHDPAQRWHYAPDMRTDEALLIKCFDSARDGRARLSAHSAFDDPTAPPDAPPRESIEIRTLAFF